MKKITIPRTLAPTHLVVLVKTVGASSDDRAHLFVVKSISDQLNFFLNLVDLGIDLDRPLITFKISSQNR